MRVGLLPLPARVAKDKNGAPGLHQAETRLAESPGTQQLPP